MDARKRTVAISLPIDARVKMQLHAEQALHFARDPFSERARRRDSASLRTRDWLMFLLFALLIAGACAAARAQSTFGSIRGTVEDAQGAVIPGASIAAHSLDEVGSPCPDEQVLVHRRPLLHFAAIPSGRRQQVAPLLKELIKLCADLSC